MSEENKEYPILELCKLGKVSRAAYYKWLNRIDSPNDKLNKIIAKKIEQMHIEHPKIFMSMIKEYYACAAKRKFNLL